MSIVVISMCNLQCHSTYTIFAFFANLLYHAFYEWKLKLSYDSEFYFYPIVKVKTNSENENKPKKLFYFFKFIIS